MAKRIAVVDVAGVTNEVPVMPESGDVAEASPEPMPVIIDETAPFTEGEFTAPKSSRVSIKLTGDGRIDWSSMRDKTRDQLQDALKREPRSPIGVPDDIADATVLACVNAVMVVEAVGISTLGPRIAPILSEIKLPVAIKACTVNLDEIRPILPAGKRLIKKYTPAQYLEHQDIVVVVEHLGKVAAARFAQCIALAAQLRMQASKPNGSPKVNDQPITM